MSAAEITKQLAGASPRLKARVAGLLYLLIFIAAPSGAATATAAKMVITLTCDTGVALILYDLLKPVSKCLSLFAALFRLIFVAVMAVNSLNYFGALDLFQSAHSSAAFNSGYGIAMVPFGVHCLLIGYLILKSTFLPRTLGVLMTLAGVGYLAFLWPPLGSRLFFPYIAITGVLGEGSLTLWLIIRGVNAQRWTEQASATRPSTGAVGNNPSAKRGGLNGSTHHSSRIPPALKTKAKSLARVRSARTLPPARF
jgi:Domain of unknown function (DUF4386)